MLNKLFCMSKFKLLSKNSTHKKIAIKQIIKLQWIPQTLKSLLTQVKSLQSRQCLLTKISENKPGGAY